MATGSGKTRTIVSLVDVLLRKGWVRNILFLADRTSLVAQAADTFTNLLPTLSSSNICKNGRDYHARCIFSTYQTMINLIDTEKEKDGSRTFSNGHFDLIILDEAHRSIYNKYRAIFDYFDSFLIGLTATPKDEIGKDTYRFFGLERGIPTYGYELAQAVEDRYLVDYKSVEVEMKLLNRGIVYDDLPKDERDEYENLFLDDEIIPPKIESSKINEWLFNIDTIVKVLDIVMRLGQKINDGSTIGKTIIFAKSHRHAEKILEIFNQQYPNYVNQCQVIDNQSEYPDDMINKFRDPNSKVRIAVSVDMLDTGIDIPDILNLVFFKPVYSRSKFWQMIGRGTRLCPNLIDGKDKQFFYIFDFCRNFEFFRINPKGTSAEDPESIQGRIFIIKLKIAYLLQDIQFQAEPYTSFRKEIVKDVEKSLNNLCKSNFAVQAHMESVDRFSRSETLNALTESKIVEAEQELAPLILPYDKDPDAVRMDALMLAIEYRHISGIPNTQLFSRLRSITGALSKQMTIPDVASRSETISMVLQDGSLENGNLTLFEQIRKELRDILTYIRKAHKNCYDTDFLDEVLTIDVKESNIIEEKLVSYREKAEHYIRKHENEPVIRKLKTNMPLSDSDLQELQTILWSEVGTIDEYNAESNSKPLPQFIREITGLDINAAKQAFSKYLDESTLNPNQIYFINQIIEYVVRNGVITDFGIFTDAPFTNRGSVSEIFTDVIWNCVRSAIDEINANAGIVI